MAQLNIYVPDELAARLKAEALKANLPLSRYVANQLTQKAADVWPEGYFEKTFGFWQGDAPVIEDLPAEPFDEMDNL